MLVFPGLLKSAARRAGIKTPDGIKGAGNDEFDTTEFPHFSVFCNAQLGQRMHPGEHWTNAEVISKIPDDKIKLITVGGLQALGFQGL